MPTEEQLEKKTVKVAVFDFDEKDIALAKQANLGKSLAGELETFLAKNKLAELVDRNASSKLQQEIQLAEMNKTGAYAGPKVADYAVSGIITNADFNSKYVEGSVYINPKNGNTVTIPPKFVYKAAVSGNIKVYELPSLDVVNAIDLLNIQGVIYCHAVKRQVPRSLHKVAFPRQMLDKRVLQDLPVMYKVYRAW